MQTRRATLAALTMLPLLRAATAQAQPGPSAAGPVTMPPGNPPPAPPGAPPGAPRGIPAGDTLAFRIMRDGSRIGTHSVSFTRNGESLLVHSQVEIVVRLGPIPLYRYRHHNHERWHAGLFDSIDAKTNDDGTPDWALARRETGGIVVQGERVARYVAPPHTLAATHWNSGELQVPLINPQTAKLMRVAVAPPVSGTVALASGTEIPATRYVASGDMPLNLWYDAAGVWAGLYTVAKDGSQVRYERL
jgi:hypothetical protein